MKDRLRLISESLGTSFNKMSKDLGFSQGYLSQMASGVRAINDRVINLLVLTYNVNREWFETGEGEMFTTPAPASPPPTTFDLDATVDEFVAVVAKLPREMQELIAKIGLSICDKLDLSPLGACADETTDKGNSQQN